MAWQKIISSILICKLFLELCNSVFQDISKKTTCKLFAIHKSLGLVGTKTCKMIHNFQKVLTLSLVKTKNTWTFVENSQHYCDHFQQISQLWSFYSWVLISFNNMLVSSIYCTGYLAQELCCLLVFLLQWFSTKVKKDFVPLLDTNLIALSVAALSTNFFASST